MKLSDRLNACDRVQRSRGFKLVVSAVIAVASIVGFVSYAVIVAGQDTPAATDTTPDAEYTAPDTMYDDAMRSIDTILATREDPTSVGVGIVALAAVSLTVVWLGLGLTYLALGGTAVLVAVGLSQLAGADGPARLLLGALALSASLAALMRAARVLLGGAGPVSAIASNVLAESVRMKISLVFIVMLIFGLAALPALLDEQEELRYRVMSFLQYATGGSFVLLALLTLFFSCSTVAFEQRDKVVWQTVTKPVAAWQYILGKWLGIVTLNGVLLIVCGTGIFLFTEYLRGTPAVGEREAYVAESGAISRDRLILQSQVLTARVSVQPTGPYEDGLEDPAFLDAVEQYIKTERRANPDFAKSDAELREIKRQLYKDVETIYRSIEPGAFQVYKFEGLSGARRRNIPITFRYRIDAEGNRPDRLYKISLDVRGAEFAVRNVPLGIMNSTLLNPSTIDDDGALLIRILNGDARTRIPNTNTISLPEGTLEISYAAGSYRANFARVVFVLWLKLGFIAMVGVLASTFLSFPVACLVAATVFLSAEGAGYIGSALEIYGTTNQEGQVVWYKLITVSIATPIQKMFVFYSDLRPTRRLVDGQLLSFGTIALRMSVLAGLTVLLYGVAVLIWRRRELAIYSGH